MSSHYMRSKSKKIIIARLFGGLGNQLFIYAAGRAMALRLNAGMKLDTKSGFECDRLYGRKYLLDRFGIVAEPASKKECMLGITGKIRRIFMRKYYSRKPFTERRYLVEDIRSFDKRLTEIKLCGPTWIEGYWQSEDYFRECRSILTKELVVEADLSTETLAIGESINARPNAVGVHVRRYGEVPTSHRKQPSIGKNYYEEAASVMLEKYPTARFFCFADDPGWAEANLSLGAETVFVNHNQGKGNDGAIEDHWLLRQCDHFIISNSTFSWWGAWLGGDNSKKTVIGHKQCIPMDGMVVLQDK